MNMHNIANAEPISATEWLKRYDGDKVNEDGSLRLAPGDELDSPAAVSMPFSSLPTHIIRRSDDNTRMRDSVWPENINTRACVVSAIRARAARYRVYAVAAWKAGRYGAAVRDITACLYCHARAVFAWVKLGFTKSPTSC